MSEMKTADERFETQINNSRELLTKIADVLLRLEDCKQMQLDATERSHLCINEIMEERLSACQRAIAATETLQLHERLEEFRLRYENNDLRKWFESSESRPAPEFKNVPKWKTTLLRMHKVFKRKRAQSENVKRQQSDKLKRLQDFYGKQAYAELDLNNKKNVLKSATKDKKLKPELSANLERNKHLVYLLKKFQSFVKSNDKYHYFNTNTEFKKFQQKKEKEIKYAKIHNNKTKKCTVPVKNSMDSSIEKLLPIVKTCTQLDQNKRSKSVTSPKPLVDEKIDPFIFPSHLNPFIGIYQKKSKTNVKSSTRTHAAPTASVLKPLLPKVPTPTLNFSDFDDITIEVTPPAVPLHSILRKPIDKSMATSPRVKKRVRFDLPSPISSSDDESKHDFSAKDPLMAKLKTGVDSFTNLKAKDMEMQAKLKREHETAIKEKLNSMTEIFKTKGRASQYTLQAIPPFKIQSESIIEKKLKFDAQNNCRIRQKQTDKGAIKYDFARFIEETDLLSLGSKSKIFKDAKNLTTKKN